MAFLEFFMDLKLNYDVSYETDKIGPTTNPLTDIEDEMTREKLPFLYDVAMTMRDGAKPEVQLGIWRLVVDKLIDRTGMSNKEFSVWASRILAEGGGALPCCARTHGRLPGRRAASLCEFVVGGGGPAQKAARAAPRPVTPLGAALKYHVIGVALRRSAARDLLPKFVCRSFARRAPSGTGRRTSRGGLPSTRSSCPWSDLRPRANHCASRPLSLGWRNREFVCVLCQSSSAERELSSELDYSEVSRRGLFSKSSA